jgi:hypothetical protein
MFSWQDGVFVGSETTHFNDILPIKIWGKEQIREKVRVRQ